VFLYIHAVVRHLTLFVWVRYYNSSNRLLCLYTLIYAARLLPADSDAASLAIALRHTPKNKIELAVYLAFITKSKSHCDGRSVFGAYDQIFVTV
jgi:hypothetical protein